MKTFLIINGKTTHVIEKETAQDAHDYAVNFMDHSKEVIVREIDNFQFKQNKSEKLVRLVATWHQEAEYFKLAQAKMSTSMSTLAVLNKDIYAECHRLGINISELKLNG